MTGTALAVHTLPSQLATPGNPSAALVEAFLSGRNPRTLDAYRKDLEDFRAYVGAPTPHAAAAVLFGGSQGEANGLALGYRAHLTGRGLSPNTVNRRLAALRSLVKLARTLGRIPWSLDVDSVKAQPYRDTRGPGRAGFRRLVDTLDTRLDAKAKRDRAAVRLLYDLALRRGEVVALDMEDLDAEAGTVSVLGKGRTQKQRMTLPEPTRAALVGWVEARGTEAGPLFLNFDRAGKGGRLTGTSLYRIVRELGEDAGVQVRPHGLRHAAITEALDLTGGDVRSVRKFSRHAKLDTLMVYDDNRTDLAGEIARRLAAA
jgi:integrase/recombinase XerC